MGRSSAPRLASSSAASLPGRSECPGAHCSLIVKEKKTAPARSARVSEVKNTEERTDREPERKKKNRGILGAAETSRELAE